MIKKKKYVLLQVILCVLFLLQPVFLPAHPPHGDNGFLSYELVRDILTNGLIIVFFYANYYYIIPKFYFTKKYIIYFTIVLISSILLIMFPYKITEYSIRDSMSFDRPPPPPHFDRPDDFRPMDRNRFQMFFTDVDHSVFLFISSFFLSLLLKIRTRWFEAIESKKNVEIAYLLAQINPHFLFNALNSLYSLTIKENAPNSAQGILKLSELMRYNLAITKTDFVSLDREIQYVIDYIELQKLRLDTSIKVHCEFKGDFNKLQIAPQLLIPFIENAFKYGVNPDENCEINIKIQVLKNVLELTVDNIKVTYNKAFEEKIGLG